MTTNTTPVCLVTGALGFLGRALGSQFAQAGYEVVGVDRGEAPEGVGGLSRFESIELPHADLQTLIARLQPAVLVHAAGPASVADSMADPLSDFAGTVGILGAVLDAVRLHSPETKVVALSSAAVYGQPDRLPVSETDRLRPLSPYGFHKQMVELLLAEYTRVYGVRSAALRIFSAYGAGLRRQILWDVCRKADTGVVELFGTGEESRDFVHATDVARAALAVVRNAPMHAETYNVASGVETRIVSLAEQLVALVAPGVPVVFNGVDRKGDPSRWVADISKLRALGFEPSIDLDAGVTEYSRWYATVRDGS